MSVPMLLAESLPFFGAFKNLAVFFQLSRRYTLQTKRGFPSQSSRHLTSIFTGWVNMRENCIGNRARVLLPVQREQDLSKVRYIVIDHLVPGPARFSAISPSQSLALRPLMNVTHKELQKTSYRFHFTSLIHHHGPIVDFVIFLLHSAYSSRIENDSSIWGDCRAARHYNRWRVCHSDRCSQLVTQR